MSEKQSERLRRIIPGLGNHMSDGAWAMFHEAFDTIERLEDRISRIENPTRRPQPKETGDE